MFRIKPSDAGEEVLADCLGNYLGGFSVEFSDAHRSIAPDGVSEVREARLIAAALVGTPAYTGATFSTDNELAGIMRHAEVERTLATIGPRPDVDLSPIPGPGGTDSDGLESRTLAPSRRRLRHRQHRHPTYRLPSPHPYPSRGSAPRHQRRMVSQASRRRIALEAAAAAAVTRRHNRNRRARRR